jgi:hypothetical protein
MKAPAFLTRRQVAEVLQVPQRIVDQLIATGQLPPFRVSMGIGRGGQRIFYSLADVRKIKRRARRRNKR